MVLMDRSGLRVRNTTDIHENMEGLDGATIADLVLSLVLASFSHQGDDVLHRLIWIVRKNHWGVQGRKNFIIRKLIIIERNGVFSLM